MKNKIFLATIAAAVAIPAVVAPVQAQGVQEVSVGAVKDFTDVPKSHRNYDVIMDMQKSGIIKGYEDGTFRPQQPISRMHVASLLDRAITLKPVREAEEFKDVPKTHSYYEIIQKIQRAGVVDGDKGYFKPNGNLTRVQMAKILVNAFDLKVKAEYDFPDVPTSHWGNKYVRALYSNGITLGDNGYFKPNEPVTRAHYAVFLHRLLNIDEDFVAPPIPQPKPEPKPDPKPPTGVDIPKDEDVKIPQGWKESVIKDHEKKIEETVFKYSPKKGTGVQFGTSGFGLGRFTDGSDFLGNIEKDLKSIPSSVTINEWVAAVNYVLKTGKVYIAPDNSFALYAGYGKLQDGTEIASLFYTR